MFQELKNEISEVFDRQLQDLLANRHIFRQLDEAWKRNVNQPQAVELQGFMWQGYLAFACTAVRKMVDPDQRSVSLLNFLIRLKEPASLAVVRRAEFCNRYTNDLIRAKCANRDFDNVTGGQPDLTAAIIDRDVQSIKTAAQPIRRLVNTVIAHSNRNQLAATLNDLDAAIDTLTAVYDRYALLVGAIRTNGLDLDYLASANADILKIWP